MFCSYIYYTEKNIYGCQKGKLEENGKASKRIAHYEWWLLDFKDVEEGSQIDKFFSHVFPCHIAALSDQHSAPERRNINIYIYIEIWCDWIVGLIILHTCANVAPSPQPPQVGMVEKKNCPFVQVAYPHLIGLSHHLHMGI